MPLLGLRDLPTQLIKTYFLFRYDKGFKIEAIENKSDIRLSAAKVQSPYALYEIEAVL